MTVGAGLALWGRKRSIDAYNTWVPAPFRRSVNAMFGERVRGFLRDVKREETRRSLNRQLSELDDDPRRRGN